jgi:penicillin-binding protein-related factor A (putative recombinase)
MRRRSAIDAARAAALEGLNVPPLIERVANPQRVAAGRLAHAAGESLERWLDGQHRLARSLGLGHIRKVGAPVVVGRGGKPVEWAGTGPSDYQGVLRGGIAIAIEAKSVEHRLSRADVRLHQQHDLAAVSALGGIALLAVEIRDQQLIAVVPWQSVPWTQRSRQINGRTVISHTVGADELDAWRLRGACYISACVPT